MMRRLITIMLFCFMLIPAMGYCELYGVKSAMKDGLTSAVPIYSNSVTKAYATADTIENAICWQNYAQDGKFFMRMYYECLNDECIKHLVNIYKEGISDKTMHRWSNIGAENIYFWSADTIFDIAGKQQIVGQEFFYDKWGYLMANSEHKPPLIEELSVNYPFSFEIAKRINSILAKQLADAKENPHSCLNNGSQRRIINQTRLPRY